MHSKGKRQKERDGDTNTGVERGKAEEEDGGCALEPVFVTEPMSQFASPDTSASESQL